MGARAPSRTSPRQGGVRARDAVLLGQVWLRLGKRASVGGTAGGEAAWAQQAGQGEAGRPRELAVRRHWSGTERKLGSFTCHRRTVC